MSDQVITKEQAMKELRQLSQTIDEKLLRKHDELQAQMQEKRELEETVEALKKENSILQKRLTETASSKAEQLFAELVKPIIEREVAKLNLAAPMSGGSSGGGTITGTMDNLMAEIKMRERKYEFDTAKNTKDQVLAVMLKEFPQAKVRMKELKEALQEYGYKEAYDDINGLLVKLINEGWVVEEYQDSTHKAYRLPGKVIFTETK
jgi:hypothetical protein